MDITFQVKKVIDGNYENIPDLESETIMITISVQVQLAPLFSSPPSVDQHPPHPHPHHKKLSWQFTWTNPPQG